jgi:signal transduction histidine kinase
MDPKQSRAFFEPFRQGDGSTARLHGGMGLGLTVAQRLIDGHRGQIEITSGGRGQGATVVVSLPATA